MHRTAEYTVHAAARVLGAVGGLVVMTGIALLAAALARPAAIQPAAIVSGQQTADGVPTLQLSLAPQAATPPAGSPAGSSPAITGGAATAGPVAHRHTSHHKISPPVPPAYPKPCTVKSTPGDPPACRPSCPPCRAAGGTVCPMAAGTSYVCIAPCAYSAGADPQPLCN